MWAVHSKLRHGRIDYTLLTGRRAAANGSETAAIGAITSAVEETRSTVMPLLHDDLVVIAGVPFDDIGGGQRGAQLARVALQTGRKVTYVHVYQKFDFERGVPVRSQVKRDRLRHEFIDDVTPADVLAGVSADATILIEHPHPKALPFMKLAKARGLRVVFDLIDDWETSLGGDWFKRDVFERFVEECDIPVGSAHVLVDKLREMGRTDAVYAPNAANEYIFDKYKNYNRPHDLPKNRRCALYFGSLYGEWFAWDHIEAAARRNPDTDFVLIGDLAKKPILPDNVHFLGAKEIDELPAYLNFCDIALLPFVPGKISDAVSPIKVFEYLFLNKPVVATQLPEIADYPNVFIASSRDEFAALCGQAGENTITTLENDRFIMRNSWLTRLDTICGNRPSAKKVSVIILIHNNESIIERCLESFVLHAADFITEIIVVDNASSDGGPEIVRTKFPSVKLLSNPQNGCSSGRNLGASAASGDILAFFDSDQWLTSSAPFAEAISILEKDASVGAVSWGAGWFEDPETSLGGPIVDYIPDRAMTDGSGSYISYRTDIAYLATSGMFIPKMVFSKTGGFDTYYDPTCFEDTDMAFQVKDLGLRIAYRDLSGVRHQPHQTTGASISNKSYMQLFERNAAYFRSKWKNRPEFFTRLEDTQRLK